MRVNTRAAHASSTSRLLMIRKPNPVKDVHIVDSGNQIYAAAKTISHIGLQAYIEAQKKQTTNKSLSHPVEEFA